MTSPVLFGGPKMAAGCQHLHGFEVTCDVLIVTLEHNVFHYCRCPIKKRATTVEQEVVFMIQLQR